jgi:flagellar biosynthesis protein FlhG
MSKTTDWLTGFRHKNVATTIAFVSGKGGVGKTSCSLKISKLLASQGKRVLLIDCDFNLSNTLIKLNLKRDNKFDDFLNKKISARSLIKRVYGFDLIPTANGSLSVFEKEQGIENILVKLIESLKESYDFILLDCPAGIEKNTLNLVNYCDERIIVVTPDKSSLTDAYSVLKILITRYENLKNCFLLNQIVNLEIYESFKNAILKTSKTFLGYEPFFLGHFPLIPLKGDDFDRVFIQEESFSMKDYELKVLNNLVDRDKVESCFSVSEQSPKSLFEEVR